MWCPLFVVLLAGVATAEHLQGWKTDTEYQYAIRGRTLAALHDISDQYSGIILRALLTVRPKSDETLEAKVTEARFAQIHTKLPDGWDTKIPDNMLEFKQFPLSEKVFEIKMKHGVVRDLSVDKNVSTWEVNVLKSIASQLQVDTQGENMIASRSNQEPEDSRDNAMFKTMEDSVGGKCEVLYDINPLPDFVIQSKPELVPLPEVRGGDNVMDIIKTKNFNNCEQRSGYHFGFSGSNKWKPGASDEGNFLSRSSISRIIITGNLKTFTIQSSVSTNKVILSPNFNENRKGMVSSRVNLTLLKMDVPTSDEWSSPVNSESTGNLVYSYNNPFANAGEERPAGQPKEDLDSDDEHDKRYARYWQKKIRQDDDDESNSSDASKDADSMESSREQSNLQMKPTLNEAPSLPLLPFFIGNRGKSIHKDDQLDVVATVKILAGEIGNELHTPNRITDEQTLEKFSILAKLIRTLNTEQIGEAQRELYQSANEIDPDNESQTIKRNTWIAFRDAVAQAGTGPALVNIKNWIKEKKIRGIEAASIVGVLSKTARTPTKEYMDTFFELVTMPETRREQFLNSTALITFAELVRYSNADHPSAHSCYPVHTFGFLLPKDNPAMSRDWLPYMAEELKKSMENKEYAKSLAFIAALGDLADPKILAVFEPYLEGKVPASTFQRLSMVLSLNKLAALKPVLVRNIFYRIYQNTGEAHQLRSAAVSSLMMTTNPPGSMLDRMAAFTNEDHSKHVNAAVKSNIESASQLEAHEWRELASNARKAKSLLNKESYGFEYSQNYLTDYVAKEMNLVYRMQSGYISSSDSFIPETYFASVQEILGGVKIPKTIAAVMISSVKDLLKLLDKQMETSERLDLHQEKEFSPENIARLLKVKAEPREDLEGAFKIQTAYENMFFSFDKNDIQRIPEHLKRIFEALSNGHKFNIAKLESLDMTVSFPMESGFPFVYTMNIPTMVKTSGKVNITGESAEGSMQLRVIWAMQMQARLGFVTPFDHQHYLAGSNKIYQLQIPIGANIKYEPSDELVSLKLEPLDRNEKFKILHHSVDLFTSRHSILSSSPVTKDPETCKLNKLEAGPNLSSVGSRTHGLFIKIQMEKSSSLKDSTDEEDRPERNPLENFISLFTEKPDYDKLEVFIEPNPSSDQYIVLTGALQTLEDDTTEYDENRSKSITAKAPEVKNKKQNDPERRKQFLNESAVGIAAADAFVVEIGFELHGKEAIKTSTTLACASSEVDDKSRCLAYWRLTNTEKNIKLESCAGLESTSFETSHKNISGGFKPKSRKFNIDLRVGRSCKNGGQVNIQGRQEQSKKWRESIKELSSESQCKKDKERGKKSSIACEEISRKRSMLDKTHVTVKLEDKLASTVEELDTSLNLLSEFTDEVGFIKKDPEDWADKKSVIELNMKLSPEDNKASFSYESANIVLSANDVDAEAIIDLVASAESDDMTTDRMNMDLTDASLREYMCELNSNSATTFDDSSYLLELGKCWHVAMMTVPRTTKPSNSTSAIDDDMRLSVLVRDAEDSKKEVKVTLGNDELQFYNVDSKNQVKLNEEQLDLSKKRSFRHKSGKDIDFEVLQRSDGSLRLLSSKFDIEASYDGQRVQIKPSDNYRNEVRGLCGNYDGEPVNDFTSPANCVLSKPKEFAASYALTSKDCLGPAAEFAKKAEKAVCSKMSPRLGNVVSDREAGRSNRDADREWGYHTMQSSVLSSDDKRCSTWRTQIIREGDEICFSMKPVLTCASGCKATRTKPKLMPMHCVPKSPGSEMIAGRIGSGDNPNLSHKKYTKKSTFDVAMGCHAA